MAAGNDTQDFVVLVAREASVVDAVTTVARELQLPVTHYESVEAWAHSPRATAEPVRDREEAAPGTWDGCLVVGLVLDSGEGLATVRQAAGWRGGLPIIVVSPQPSIEAAVTAMRSGAMTVLTWPTSDQKLRSALREAIDLARMIRPQRERQTRVTQRLSLLTDSELAVLDALMAGRSNKEIAEAMTIGLRTVELRRSRIMAKMQADNLVELIRMVCDAKQAASGVAVAGVPVSG